MKKYFWESWKNLSDKEKIAIDSIKKCKKTLFDNISISEVYAIYIKGSFVRREMNRKSDVDIVPITYKIGSREKIEKIEGLKGHLYKPAELLPLSLEDFKLGRINSNKGGLKARPDVTLRDLHRYRLIYGKEVNTSDFPMRSDIEFLRGHIKAFKQTFIPLYKKGEFGFSDLMKQVFHLVEREQRVKGNEPPENWKDLANSIEDKNHVIQDALEYGFNPTKDSFERQKLLKKVNKYLTDLEENYLKRLN